MKMTIGNLKSSGYAPVVQDYVCATNNTSEISTISPPVGATKVTIECYGTGGPFRAIKSNYSGAGGAYSKKNEFLLSSLGVTTLYISAPGPQTTQSVAGSPAFVRANNSGGTLLCEAKGGGAAVGGGPGANGGSAALGTGDVKFSGGSTDGSAGGTPGGAAGPLGDGGSGASGGASGGGLAGAGGQEYGGGGIASSGPGRRGIVRITWS